MARSKWAPGAAPLAGAARIVAGVLSGRSADDALDEYREDASGRELPAVRAIAFGTVRWYLRLAPALTRLMRRPGQAAPALRALMAVAAHQVEYSHHAPEATVHAAVDAARILGLAHAAGAINAVMRRFVAERAQIFSEIDQSRAIRSAHPDWLISRLLATWPHEIDAILDGNNTPAPMTLRVDLTRISVEGYLSVLSGDGIDASAIPWCDSAVVLSRPRSVDALPGFRDGVVSVQDASAQLAARFLDATPGMRVLDACAAPGGKTGHILERSRGEADVTAVDVDACRMGRVRENLERLRRTARLCVADVRTPASFWDGRPYERILIDAPCSATGVIRRHPDIKLLRRDSDVAALATTQVAIMRALVPMLAAGGRLVYATCSVLPQENEEVVATVLAAEPALAHVPLPGDVPGSRVRAAGLQLLPGTQAQTDGFYYACLEKTTARP